MREQFKPSEAASNPGECGTSRRQDLLRPFPPPRLPVLQSGSEFAPQPAPTSKAELLTESPGELVFNGFIKASLTYHKLHPF